MLQNCRGAHSLIKIEGGHASCCRTEEELIL